MTLKERSAPVPVSLHGGHTSSADGSARPADMVRAAELAGMEVFGLSEHFYRPRDERFRYSFESDADDWGHTGWPSFVEDTLEVKARYAAEGGPEVLLGAEVEFLTEYEEWTRRELARWPLDYIVLSIHFVETSPGKYVPFDLTPQHWHLARRLCGGVVPLYVRYYEHAMGALSWNLADVIGHLDIVKIHAEEPVRDPAIDEILDRVLRKCVETGTVLDLNARGFVKACKEIIPSVEILRRACELGVEIVPGDDSHAPRHVGHYLHEAVTAARVAGYRRISLPPRLGARSWAI